ncbi:MAG: hypothetical protein ACREXT_06670, partial [Gammaproteobacteria bacterium]
FTTLAQCIEREPLARRAVPLPATTIRHLKLGNGTAIFGATETARYLYELNGETRTWPALWKEFYNTGMQHYINSEAGSASHRWLVSNVDITWQAQSQTFWKMLSPRAARAPYQSWYIPYFDRI